MAINFFNSLAVDTDVLYVDAINDRVGIGTSSPSFPLEVDGGTGDGVKIKAGNTLNDDSFLIANSSNTTLFVVNGAGNAGIATTSPSQKLHVAGNVTANRYYGNTSTVYYVDPNNSTTAAVLAGGLEIGYGSAGEYRIEVGEGRTGNGYAYIDFTGDTTYSDYGLRLIRNNTGANTSSQLLHRGSGNLEFKMQEAGTMIFSTSNSERMRIDSAGAVSVYNDFTIDNGSPEMYFKTGATHYRWMVAAQENVDAALEITPSTAVGGSTYSTPVAVFKATGNVGIGTPSPTRQLTVNGTTSSVININSNNSNGLSIVAFGDSDDDNYAQILLDNSQNKLQIQNGGGGGISNRGITIDSSENVGIGTSSPGYKLDVNGDAKVASVLYLDRTTGQPNIKGTGEGNIVIEALDASHNVYLNNYVSGDVILAAGGGDVGVGTASPVGKLDVRKVQSSTPFTTPFLKLYPSSTTNTTGHTTITLGTSTVDNYGVSLSGWRYGTNGAPKFRIKMHNNSATGIDALTIDSSGQVGIGTTNPTTKLYVAGNIQVNNPSGAANGSPNETARIVNTTSGATSSYMYIGASSGNDWRVGKNILGASGVSNFGIAKHSGSTLALEIDGSSNVISSVSSRAPIFYDSNDTTYYVDPASTSTSGKFRQFVNIGDSSSYSSNSGTWGARLNVVDDVHARIDVAQDANSMHSLWYAHTGQSTIKFGTTSNHGVEFLSNNSGRGQITNGGTLEWWNNVSAPIFYDYNNTGYYVDPANVSQLADIYYNAWLRNNRTASSSGLYWESGTPGSGWHIYPLDQADMYIRAGSGNGSLRFTTGNETARGYVHWTTSNEVGFLNNARSWSLRVDNSGNTFATTSHRAPIFYDSNNTGYYVNPASTSSMQGIHMNNGNITNVNNITINDPGVGEGIEWLNGNGWKIYESPDNLTNAAGNLQFVTSSTRLATITTSGTFELSGGGIGSSSDSVAKVLYPKGATYTEGSNNVTGAIKITLPQSWTNTMMKMHVSIFDYSSDESFDLILAGYNYSGGGGYWVNCSSQAIGSPNVDRSFNIRYGHDGNKCCIFIGETTSTWNYPKVVVTKFMAGHSNNEFYKWDDDWDITRETSLASNIDVTQVAYQQNRYIQILYDIDNTSYYVDPASTSNLNVLTVPGSITMGTVSGAPNSTRLKIAGIGNGGCALFVEGAGLTTNIQMTLPTYAIGMSFNNTGSFGANALSFLRNGQNAGNITVNTNFTTSYNTSSDYRLKENVVKLTNGIEKVKQLKPKRFNFILDEDKQIIDGFIAHEAKEVVPESVTGEKDEVLPNGEPSYQGMDNSKLVPVLTAALQEAITKIEDLETRIQILENQ